MAARLGRPPKPKGEKQSKHVMVRFTPAEYRAFAAYAKRRDQPLAVALRELALRAVKREGAR